MAPLLFLSFVSPSVEHIPLLNFESGHPFACFEVMLDSTMICIFLRQLMLCTLIVQY